VAGELYKLNLFVGTGTTESGEPTFELSRPMTRIEALVALIRLMGLEADASRSSSGNPFADVPDWADRTAAYAYSIGLTVGINDEHTLFGADAPATPGDFTVFLLRILGYSEASGDFSYSDARRKAVEAGLLKVFESAAINADGVLLRAEAVIAMAIALISNPKGSQTSLVEKLATEGRVPKDAASEFKKSFTEVYKR
jgi:hypothetical protein